MSYYRSDLHNLQQNTVWKELKENAADLIFGLQGDLEEMDPQTEMVKMARIQGKISALRMVFDAWIDDIKIEIEETEEEIKNGLDE